MAQTNSISNKTSELTVDPSAATDSFIQLDESTVAKWRVGNDATDDSYRLSQGSALGTNDTFIMTSSGERTMPLQPAFLAFNSATDSNVTGDATTYTVVFDTEVFDQNSDYNNATGVFTAPITGRYLFTANVRCAGIAAGMDTGYITMVASNRDAVFNELSPVAAQRSGTVISFHGSVVLDMDAGDTCSITVRIDGGAKVADVWGAAGTDNRTHFSGYLVC